MMRFKGWFGPKLAGYGISPRSWQGWLATAILFGILAGKRFLPPPELYGLPHWAAAALPGAVLLLYFVLVWATYDPDL